MALGCLPRDCREAAGVGSIVPDADSLNYSDSATETYIMECHAVLALLLLLYILMLLLYTETLTGKKKYIKPDKI